MATFVKEKDDKRYLLTCNEVLSKYAWAIPLHTKTDARLINAFSRRDVDRCRRRQRVSEQTVPGIFKGINASVAERFNRTLKGRMDKYFAAHNTRRNLHALRALVRGYNRAVHWSIRRGPIKVTTQHQKEVR
ncbi:uncharacterized protein LOC135473574 [Liolophura sinensis]|uniref:uncharacterized protein LOC135473574 n=1 Tax=Liolophura sinensis TaxID=3198878 RepID=UPI0031595092